MLIKNIREKVLIATDLDGTFLHSDNQKVDELYDFIERYRSEITLVFVTGRGIESVFPILSEFKVPSPDFIISDVGATFHDVKANEFIHHLQKDIEQKWPGYEKILDELRDFRGLNKQKVPQQRRCSFTFDEVPDISELSERVKKLQCEVLVSAGKYLDVLPKGVNKGTSLLKLIEYIGFNPKHVIAAGDTLNDLSLFQTGIKAVAVGNSEQQLIDQVKNNLNAIVARNEGTGGIVEALIRFGFVYRAPLSSQPLKVEVKGQSQLLIVYHRQPFDEIREGKTIKRIIPKSPNGIIPTLLGFFSDEIKGSWVAWSQQSSRFPRDFEYNVEVDQELYQSLNCARVPLTADDVNIFYKRFSKEAFWPIIFSFPSRFEVNHDHWNTFKEVNRLFAERTASEAKEGAWVWIHDYNLWLVPGFLRLQRPDLRIAFFHHTAFPSADIFNLLPWKKEIISSLIQCDHIGFHIPRYIENFVDVVRSNFPIEVEKTEFSAPRYLTYGSALGIDKFSTRIRTQSRTIDLAAFPVGINNKRIKDICETYQTKAQIKAMREEVGDKKVILSVERLDYVKGPIEKIEAYEKFLEKNPHLHGRVVFFNVVTPPAPGMEIYRSTREKLDQIIGRVNGRFAKINWTPIKYFYRSFPFEEVIPFYAFADIAWITPLRDGLNLVSKEFVASKGYTGEDGILILSEFAGAAVELHGAILVNPFDQNEMVASLEKAFDMDVIESKLRMKQLFSIVSSADVSKWSQDYMNIFKED